MTNQEIANGLCSLLNQALSKDSKAISELASDRVVCNDALADDPDVTVLCDCYPEGGEVNLVGMLGIVNGFCNHLHLDCKIAARYSDDGKNTLIEFVVFPI
jgi:hypothetical protein